MKFTNSFPVIGSISLPILTITFSSLIETIVLASVGALVGCLVKYLFEKATK